jgi:hypothetical protein
MVQTNSDILVTEKAPVVNVIREDAVVDRIIGMS